MRNLWLVVLAFALGACASSDDGALVVERVERASATFVLHGEGSLRAVQSTPLVVPGAQWSQRRIDWIVEDSSVVREGDLIARFSDEQSKRQLAATLLELQRNTLTHAAKKSELESKWDQLELSSSQVDSSLAIARRYANAGGQAVARDTILDAIQDQNFLEQKKTMLAWKRGLFAVRERAEIAPIDVRRATFEGRAKELSNDLAALEIRAPHAGLVVLEADWSGQKPRAGASMWAGNNFATLPDIRAMEVELSLPQIEAQGIREGMKVELSQLGKPQQKAVSKISWIAAAATRLAGESPVNYLTMKLPVPVDAAKKYGWLPGQRFAATVVILDDPSAITVPNIALYDADGATQVKVSERGAIVARIVQVGVRGPSRTQILSGLNPGESVVLTAPAGSNRSKPASKSVP